MISRTFTKTAIATAGAWAALAFASAGSPALAQPCETSYYDHNGSRMRAERCGGELSIWYDAPRDGIAKQGVRPGTLFFDGFLSFDGARNLIAGTARVFKSGCKPGEFSVEGYYTVTGGPIRLEGEAPRRNSSCATTGYRREVLEFR